MRVVLCLLVYALAGVPIASAQGFEVASIKPSPPPPGNPFGFPVIGIIRFEPGGRVTATTATVRELIRRAYDRQDSLTIGRIPGAPPPADDAVSLLTGVQEQLGLRLESARGSVDVLVIDGAEEPYAN
jgi:hypothetical protein